MDKKEFIGNIEKETLRFEQETFSRGIERGRKMERNILSYGSFKVEKHILVDCLKRLIGQTSFTVTPHNESDIWEDSECACCGGMGRLGYQEEHRSKIEHKADCALVYAENILKNLEKTK